MSVDCKTPCNVSIRMPTSSCESVSSTPVAPTVLTSLFGFFSSAAYLQNSLSSSPAAQHFLIISRVGTSEKQQMRLHKRCVSSTSSFTILSGGEAAFRASRCFA